MAKFKLTPATSINNKDLRYVGMKFFQDEEGTLYVRIWHQIGAYKNKENWAYYYACKIDRPSGELIILQHVLREEVNMEPTRLYRDCSQWGDPWYLPKTERRNAWWSRYI